MSPAFIILALITVASTVAAMTLRNLVHCALSLAVAFAGLAGIYLSLDAQFVGFAQILVYVGAVAILIVFAILLTRSSGPSPPSVFSSSWFVGAGIAAAAFLLLTGMILSSKRVTHGGAAEAVVPVREIGEQLMTRYILPLEIIGLLLTAALIGAVIIAIREKTAK